MNQPIVHHHPTCTADYPEKPDDELPQQIVRQSLGEDDRGDDEVIYFCVDCGAFVIVKEKP